MTWTFALEHPPAGDADELRSLLGGKGANLATMATELGMPVPPGFVISTEACKAYGSGSWPDGLDAELRSHVASIEQRMQRGFGDPRDPLLVSVRSGAPVSMPGMLDTILNLGLNDATTQGLAAVSGDAGFAEACRRRLGNMFRETVGEEDIPEDPWRQLRSAIEAVFRSWDSERAQSYRSREGIADDLGTAVVVQAMVFGNRSPDSATGVLFTRNPATGENVLYGDILFQAQGEDVVAGTHATEPIAVLDDRLPDLAAELHRYADVLERHYADVCDIEFTIEDGRLWMLQNRIGKRGAHAALRIAVEMAEDDAFPLSRRDAVGRVAAILADPPRTFAREQDDETPIVAEGLPASPGLAVGDVATSPQAAVEMADGGRAVILARSETSPDDVHGMARAAGILTSTGGLASHAAVVARGWDVPAVVGASAVTVEDGAIRIGAQTWKAGETISIDGGNGAVYAGPVRVVETIAEDASTLLEWASQLGITVARTAAIDESPITVSNGDLAATDPEDVVRALSIKGYVTPELLAPALGLDEAAAEQCLRTLVDEDLATESSGMFSLTDAGKARGQEMLAADQRDWGADNAAAALDDFLAFDVRMKTIVTAWQMRVVDGEQVLNDHADSAYDAGVLSELAGLDADASAWSAKLPDGLSRLSSYRRRLDAAAAAAGDGDGRFIASPRVDSYHGIWFELHEDLIRLAGRTREEETAAGRA